MTTRFGRAKDLAILHLGDLVPELFGHGPKQTRRNRNGSWQVANRWRHGADPGQMKVWPGGAWKDFVSGDKGDAVDLVAYGLAGAVTDDTRMTALKWLEDRYGLGTMDPAERARLDEDARRRRQAMDTEAEAARSSARERARKAFYAAEATIGGTAAEIYLKGRGIDIGLVPHPCPSFRFRAQCDYWPGRTTGGGSSVAPAQADRRAPQFPAMLSAMLDARGKLGAVHYTFLEPDGASKLKTLERSWFEEKSDGRRVGRSAKLMFPETTGLVIRVTRGPSGLSCEEAAAKGVKGYLLVTEGIEDAMTFALADPELRVHAAGSLSGLLAVPDLDCVEGYLIARDNDWDKPQAVELFDRALAHFKSFGKPVEPVAVPREWGKDANDVLNLKG